MQGLPEQIGDFLKKMWRGPAEKNYGFCKKMFLWTPWPKIFFSKAPQYIGHMTKTCGFFNKGNFPIYHIYLIENNLKNVLTKIKVFSWPP